jgi:hypothetical protein
MKEFVDSFLDAASQELLNSWKATFKEGTIPETDIPRVRSLVGDGHVMIAEKVNKPKRFQWKEYMTPVINHKGSPTWVHKDYQGFYK